MPTNADRRRTLADAAVALVARDGLRGLTHRAVDAEAGVPTGTASNYFRRRDDLLEAAATRAVERLRAPAPAPAEGRGIDALARLVGAHARACLDDVDALLAWTELRMHAARADLPAVAALQDGATPLTGPGVLGGTAGAGVLAGAGLPGSPEERRRLRHALDGVLLAAATGAVTRAQALDDVDALVRGLVTAPATRRWFKR